MKILRYAWVILVHFPFFLCAQTKLSDEAQISIVIEGPYQKQVYSAFGHIGFRIQDPVRNMDWFFNYGVYDFNQENFFLNFARGLLKYKVVAYDFRYLMQNAQKDNRYLKEQVLNLTQEERQQFFDFLSNNILPENAEYLYNYIYDNCATKIRDIPIQLFPDRITFDTSYVVNGKTIRNLMDEYLQYQTWGDFAIDLGLGLEIDQPAPALVYLFLPEYVVLAFEGATIDREGKQFPLVDKTVNLHVPMPTEHKNIALTPLNSFILLFFLVGFITNRNYRSGKRTQWIDYFLFSLVSLVGIWVHYLWFGTEHLSQNNLNILWAIPLHLPLVWISDMKKMTVFSQVYFKIIAIWYCILLLIWPMLPQPLGTSVVPLLLAMILRSFYISYDLKKLYEKTKF